LLTLIKVVNQHMKNIFAFYNSLFAYSLGWS